MKLCVNLVLVGLTVCYRGGMHGGSKFTQPNASFTVAGIHSDVQGW